MAALGRAGLLAAPLPRALGGLGWGSEPEGTMPLMRALRRIGRASLPLGRLFEGHVNALRLVAAHGTPDQAEAAAADARAGCLFGVWAAERPERGLVLEEGMRRLRGGKIWCSGAGLVERALAPAQAPDGVRMLLLPLPKGTGRADLSVWTASGMRASGTGNVDFGGMEVGPGALIGPPGTYFAQPGFSGGAWRFLAVHLGGIEAVVEALRRHLDATGRGGDPHQQARLGQAVTEAEAARLWVREAAWMAEEPEAGGTDPARVVAYVDLARGAVERAGLAVMELAQRSIGLGAFLRPAAIERIARDLATYLRQPGPDRALTSAAQHALAAPAPIGELWER
ncbi:acyl-CoA/acyl-ACP dehydrogenase [Roseomonas gilardii subsp. gilardii]|uniref:acyl-CoA dehydrogenase family protein n=1 Tax=Roseomonas gilardii TaxID=257708 RepID=UPI001FF9BED7|nr:acyl-CoA dehydrogenase family protein [Roseomonas gilardii]UPG72043.1 acyl-CoA/acyl-ACP dehydrogenase [Roseomonas gilardii subsp. gilardii]